MEELDIIDIIEYKAIQTQSIYIVLYSQGYCEPSSYDETVCFINNTTDDEIIVEQIAIFIKEMSRDYKFEFDDEFYANEAKFKIDTYKNVSIKNCDKNIKLNFENIEKKLYHKLIDIGFSCDHETP